MILFVHSKWHLFAITDVAVRKYQTRKEVLIFLPTLHSRNQQSCLQEDSCHALHPRNLMQSYAPSMRLALSLLCCMRFVQYTLEHLTTYTRECCFVINFADFLDVQVKKNTHPQDFNFQPVVGGVSLQQHLPFLVSFVQQVFHFIPRWLVMALLY